MKSEEELAEFIVADPLAWSVWIRGYEAGLLQGHLDERASTDRLADLTARRIMVLQDCGEHIRKTTKMTISMDQALKARQQTTIGNYQGGPVEWDETP